MCVFYFVYYLLLYHALPDSERVTRSPDKFTIYNSAVCRLFVIYRLYEFDLQHAINHDLKLAICMQV